MKNCRCCFAVIPIILIVLVIVGGLTFYYLFHGEDRLYLVKIDQMRLMNSSYLQGYYNLDKLTIEQYNESAHVVNFEGELFIDLDENVYLQVDMYHSKPDSNESDRWSAHFPNMTICTYNQFYYKHFVMNRLKNNSNFPQFGPDDSTRVKKGKYWIKDFVIETTTAAPYLPFGTFKFEYIFSTNEIRVLLEVTFKVEPYIRPKIIPLWQRFSYKESK